MRRLVFLNRFYWPEETATAQLLTDLTSALARSYQVEVLTARTRPNLPREEIHGGVVVRRLGAGRSTRDDVSGKLIDYLRFLAHVFWHLLWRHRASDTLVALSDPPMLGATVWLATFFRKGAVIHWVQDVYPEIAIELGGPRWLRLLRPWRNLAWRRAAGCIVPSATIEDVVATAGVASARIVRCANWALPELQPVSAELVNAARVRLGLEGKFVAAYSGNLGRVHELEPLLDVAGQLRHDPAFLLLIIGRGAQRVRLAEIVTQRSLPNVRFIDAQPRESLAETLSVADVHFVTLKPGAERWVFPSKLYGIVAVARPVFFLGACDSEIARTITTNGWGRCFPPDRVSDMSEALRLLQREANHQPFAEATGQRATENFAVALEKWITFLEAANGATQPAR